MQEKQLISSLDFKLLIGLWKSLEFQAAHSGYYHTQNSMSLSFFVKRQVFQFNFLFRPFGVVWPIFMPELQKSVGIKCHILFHIKGLQFTTLPVVYALDASSLQGCTWQTDCFEITVFPPRSHFNHMYFHSCCTDLLKIGLLV